MAYNVVIQTAFIGDLFLAIPFLKRLSKISPEQKIILVCKKGLGEFFLKSGIVDQVLEVEKGHAGSYADALKKINQEKIEKVFCLHRSLRSTFFSMRIKARQKIGFGSWFKKLFFNDVVKYPKPWPDVIRQMSLLIPVDPELKQFIQSKDWTFLNRNSSPIPTFFQFPKLQIDQVTSPPSQKQVAIFPGSVWATKKWTHEGFAYVAQTLLRAGYRVCLMGGPSDKVDAEVIQRLAPGVEMLAGQMSLSDSAFFLHNFDLIVCNDSAPTHMAASLQRPVLSIFGPTVLDFGFRPWNDLSQVVELDQLSCRPCGPHGHTQCPLGHHDCMKKIDPKQVSALALKMLGEV